MRIFFEPGDIVYIDDEGTPFEGQGKLLYRKSFSTWMVQNVNIGQGDERVYEIEESHFHVRT